MQRNFWPIVSPKCCIIHPNPFGRKKRRPSIARPQNRGLLVMISIGRLIRSSLDVASLFWSLQRAVEHHSQSRNHGEYWIQRRRRSYWISVWNHQHSGWIVENRGNLSNQYCTYDEHLHWTGNATRWTHYISFQSTCYTSTMCRQIVSSMGNMSCAWTTVSYLLVPLFVTPVCASSYEQQVTNTSLLSSRSIRPNWNSMKKESSGPMDFVENPTEFEQEEMFRCVFSLLNGQKSDLVARLGGHHCGEAVHLCSTRQRLSSCEWSSMSTAKTQWYTNELFLDSVGTLEFVFFPVRFDERRIRTFLLSWLLHWSAARIIEESQFCLHIASSGR